MSHELPPIVKEMSVAIDPDEAFRHFIDRISEWWPLEHFSILGPVATSCVVEKKEGGDIYEVGEDGSVVLWGSVTRFDSPRRFECTWHPGRPPQTAQRLLVTFHPEREGDGTVIRLEHTDWETLGDNAMEVHSLYQQGWDTVFLEQYRAACERS